jgi:3-methyladenine DNA glycosylase AlkD
MGRKKSKQILALLESLSNPRNVEGMARFGINPKNTLGVSVADLRKVASKIGKDHTLALELWKSGCHEARILASIVDEPSEVSPAQVDSWVKDLDSWDVCDQLCLNLLADTPFAASKVRQWSRRKEEFVKRAAFALVAAMALHGRGLADGELSKFLPVIRRESVDGRPYVKKAVNWALR